jgi:hypothetical protein
MSDDLSVGAHAQRGDNRELVASCMTDATPLPRRLYAINDETEGTA